MEQNKVRSYFLYAVGEIALVMIGILLALQVNNWNEQRRDLDREQVYQYQLLENLNTDLGFLKRNLDFYTDVLESGIRVLAYSKTKEIQDNSNWDLVVDAFYASQIWPVLLDKSTFEELKSSGELSLLRSTTLRNALSIYYGLGETRYMQTIGINPPYRKMSRMLIPYDVQGYMWDECQKTDGDNQLLVKCDSPISENEARKLLTVLIEDKELMGELSFFMSSIRAGMGPLLEQIKMCENLISEIEESLNI